MKTKVLLPIIVSSFFIHSAFGQGLLTPPGVPAPTMKSLAQIEPRMPISFVPTNITVSGSYYLTTNLNTTVSNAIVIATSGVTLDLNGFTLSSTVANAANGGTAILIPAGLSDITILNGHIRGGVIDNGGVFSGSGFGNGIYSSVVSNVRVTGVSVIGCLYYGIFLTTGNPCVVEACTIETAGSCGIAASIVKGSFVIDCGSLGIVANQVSDSQGSVVNGACGIEAISVLNCYGTCSMGTGHGLLVQSAQNCYGYCGGSGTGIYASAAAMNCYGLSNSGTGLGAITAQNCQGVSYLSGPGISAETANNCYGQGLVRGISANVATSCSGRSDGGSYGIFATSIANTCYGSSATGTGLGTTIAIGCIGVNNSGPSVLATYKYNMP